MFLFSPGFGEGSHFDKYIFFVGTTTQIIVTQKAFILPKEIQ